MGLPLDLLWLAVPAYIILQILALAWTAGKDRLWSAAPLVIMVPVFIYTIIGLVLQHNLWPLVLLFSSPVAMLYTAVAATMARRSRNAPAPKPPS